MEGETLTKDNVPRKELALLLYENIIKLDAKGNIKVTNLGKKLYTDRIKKVQEEKEKIHTYLTKALTNIEKYLSVLPGGVDEVCVSFSVPGIGVHASIYLDEKDLRDNKVVIDNVYMNYYRTPIGISESELTETCKPKLRKAFKSLPASFYLSTLEEYLKVKEEYLSIFVANF